MKNVLRVILCAALLFVSTCYVSFAGGTYPKFDIGNIVSYSGGNNIVKADRTYLESETTITIFNDEGSESYPIPEGKIPAESDGLVNANSPVKIKAAGNSIYLRLPLGGDYNFLRLIDSKGRTLAALDEALMEKLNQEGRLCYVKLSSRQNYYAEIVSEYKGSVSGCFYVLLNIEAGKRDTFNDKFNQAAKLKESDYQAVNADFQSRLEKKSAKPSSESPRESGKKSSTSSKSKSKSSSEKKNSVKNKNKNDSGNIDILRRGVGLFF